MSLIDSLPEGFEAQGVFGRADGSVNSAQTSSFHFDIIKRLDKKASFVSEERVGERLEDLIADRRPDLIHVHNLLNPHFLEIAAAYGPALITVQDHRFFCPGRGKVKADGSVCYNMFGLGCAGCFSDEDYFFRMLTLVRSRLNVLQKFRKIIVLSGYMKDELIRVGLPEGKIHVIPPFVHGLDRVLSPTAFGRDILFAGRVVWAKGIFDLLEAMTLIDEKARIVIAGDGPDKDRGVVRATDMKQNGRITFAGWVAHHELSRYYRQARVVVVPSRWQEPFGMVGLEALDQARPVVAYDVGGVGEWLEDGRTGLTVPVGNTLALAAAINVFLRQSDDAAQMGRAGRELVRTHFDRNILMNRLTDLYQNVVNDGS